MPANSSDSPRRWFQYRLRTLFALMTAICVLLAAWNTYVAPYRKQRRAVEPLMALGAKIQTEPGGPAWLRWLFGRERFLDVLAVNLEHTKVTDDDLAALADLPHLERLYLAETRITDAGLRHVRGLGKLARMSLWRTKITDDGLADLSGLTDLEVLDVHDTALTEESLKHLRDLTNLKRLIHRMPLGDAGIARLTAFPMLRFDERLCAKGMTDAGMKHVGTIANLRDLTIDSPRVSDLGITELRSLNDLERLSVVDAQMTDASLTILARMPRLQLLGFGQTQITFPGLVRRLGTRFHKIRLDEKSVMGTSLRDARVPRLTYTGRISPADMAALGEWPQLEAICFNSPVLCEAALQHLPGLPRLEVLTLCLRGNDEGLRYLREVPSLHSLIIGGKEGLTDAGLRHLAMLTQIEYLNVEGQNLGDEQLVFLDELTNLRGLDLSRNRLTGPGLAHLKKLTKLTHLNVSYCPLGNEGLVHLRGLKNLRFFGAVETELSDAALVHLLALPKLESVLVRDSRVSDRGRRDLRKALPTKDARVE